MKASTLCLTAMLLATPALSARADLVAIWTFGPDAAHYTLIPDVDVTGSAALTAGGASYDADGGNGVAFTDAGGTLRAAGQGLHWTDVSGSSSDAEIHIALSTAGWKDLVLRFDYRSDASGGKQGPVRFDFDYRIGAGDWINVLNNQPITRDDAWHAFTIDLSGIGGLNDQPAVAFRLNDIKEDAIADGDFWMDNVQLTGSIVPEPALAALLVTGALLALRKKRPG
jgi:hypothetical protein